MPFGKQFGSVSGNESLYPAALAEFARVVRPGGIAVILTSNANSAIMRASLAEVAVDARLPDGPVGFCTRRGASNTGGASDFFIRWMHVSMFCAEPSLLHHILQTLWLLPSQLSRHFGTDRRGRHQ